MPKLIQPKNTLKEKVGDGGFKEEDLAKAQKAIEENDVDFGPIATRYLNQLKTAIETSKKNKDHSKLYAEILDVLTQLRAQGSMFQYPSITAATDTVVDLLDSLKKVDSTIIEIVQAYEKSALILVAKKIKNDKDPICQALVTELLGVCNRYKKKHA